MDQHPYNYQPYQVLEQEYESDLPNEHQTIYFPFQDVFYEIYIKNEYRNGKRKRN